MRRRVITATPLPATPYANCRLGIGATRNLTTYPIESLNLGWYVDWQTRLSPPHPGGAEYMQMVRLKQTGASSYAYKPTPDSIQKAARANPGSVWLIGNETDRRTYQDDIVPSLYAIAYHELYDLIKKADPTARVTVGGIVQITPLRLKYLNLVRAAYAREYGETLPADLWNIHTFVLREEADSWGADLPSGIDTAIGYQGSWTTETEEGITVHSSDTPGSQAVLSFKGDQSSWTALLGPHGSQVQISLDHKNRETIDTYSPLTTSHTYAYDHLGDGRHVLSLTALGNGTVMLDEFHAPASGKAAIPDDDPYPSMLYNIQDHDRLDLVQQEVVTFRQWMDRNGERNKPLIISEYGVIFPSYIVDEAGNSFTPARVVAFLTGSFDLFRQLRDPALGLPADDDRLVQRWAWYSLDDPYSNGALFDSYTKKMTYIGNAFRDYAQQIPKNVDLLPVDITSMSPDLYAPSGTITVTLQMSLANAGNVTLPITTTIRAWDGDPHDEGTLIGEGEVAAGLEGCGGMTSISMAWPKAAAGTHTIYVQIDPDNHITEANKSNNLITKTFTITNHRYWFPLWLRNS